MEKESIWKGLPAIALMKIFGELRTIDRVRMRFVCRSWKQVLTRDDLPATHHMEVPWVFQPEHSVFDSESNLLSEIQFQRFADNGDIVQTSTCRFKLPHFGDDGIGGGWLCGCSDGWLVIAAGLRSNPVMFLWNPLISKTRRLPPLMPTLGFLKSFDLSKQQNNISNYVKRLLIYSCECLVVVVFADPLGSGEGRREYLALCTPQDNKWTVFEGNYLFHDILFHDDKLYALVEQEAEESYMYEVSLSNRQVQVCILPFSSNKALISGDDLYDEERMENPLYNIAYNDHVSLRLGEFSGQLLLITVIYDRYTVNAPTECPVKAFESLQIKSFTLKTVDGMKRVESLEGNKFVILADNGFLTISSGVGGVVVADIIAFYITGEHAGGFVADSGDCVVSETGVFSLRDGRIFRERAEYLSYPTDLQYRPYVLTPKLYLRVHK